MKTRICTVILLFLFSNQYLISVEEAIQTGFSNQLSFLETKGEDWDSYPEYPEELKPNLSINSTINEDIEFEKALDPAEGVELPIKLKQNIFSKSIISKEIAQNFDEFLLGIASAWLHSVSFLRSVIHGPGFNKEECGIDILWKQYQQIISTKNKELTELITKNIPNDVSFEEKMKKCNEVLNQELSKIKTEIVKQEEEMPQLKGQLETLKDKPDEKQDIEKKIDLHKSVIKDYNKEQKQLKRIDCKQTIEDNNLTVKYGILTMSAYLKDFLSECMKCFSKSMPGKGAKVLAGADIDTLQYAGAKPLEALAHGITFGMYGIVKSMFHLIRLTLSVFKFYKAYKSSRWDDFAYHIGKSVGLSARVVLANMFQ